MATKVPYSEFCSMAPVLGVMMSVVLMRIGGDIVTKKVRKGYRACQRMSGQFKMSWPVQGHEVEDVPYIGGEFLTLLLKTPLLCVHTTLQLVANLPRYTVRSKSWAWPKSCPESCAKTKKNTKKWSARHWRYWKAWKWAYGKKAQGNTTSKEDIKTYSEYKSGQPSKFSLGHLWKIDVKWSLRRDHFHLIKKMMTKSTQIVQHGMKNWYHRSLRLGKQPYGHMSTNNSSWWGHTKGQLGSAAQIKQHKAKIAHTDGLTGGRSQVNKYNIVLKQYNHWLSLYQKVPLKTMSRWWGHVNQLELPVWLRHPALNLYIWMFSCQLHEAAVEDLTSYRNLSEFFRRQLKPGLRPIDHNADLVSPADGRVLYKGHVMNGALEQVKGVYYSLQGFLGPLPTLTKEDSCHNMVDGGMDDLKDADVMNDETDAHPLVTNVTEADLADGVDDNLTMIDSAYAESLLTDPSNMLYHCIVYLAPGDYHRFHSPADWTVQYRRHFPGELFSVNPGIARWLQGLFNFNERVVYFGKWKYGLFSMTAVGATNVGSINVSFDKDLQTNNHEVYPPGTMFDKDLRDTSSDLTEGVKVTKGQFVGDFNLGSTIVLVFEAPPGFSFSINEGQKVQYGECFGGI